MEPRIVSSTSEINLGKALSAGIDWLNGVCALTYETSDHQYLGSGTGALLYGGTYILTAAHLFDSYLSAPSGEDQVVSPFNLQISFTVNGQSTVINAAQAYVHKDYNTDTLWNDIALVRLPAPAPDGIVRYSLYTATDEVGKTFVKSGYGLGGDGSSGDNDEADPPQRYGMNTFDATGRRTDDQPGLELNTEKMLLFDFDDGLAAHDFFGVNYNLSDTGLGSMEANTAVGDSGGPGFINGRIASITSAGDSPGEYGFFTDTDVKAGVDSSYGEYSMETRVSQFIPWIESYAGQPDDTPSAGYENGVDIDWYLEEKLGQLRTGDPETWNPKTAQDLSDLMARVGLSVSGHYHQWGWQEGLNPNPYFDAEEYVAFKVNALNAAQAQGKADWTASDFHAAWNRDPYAHYREYGVSEGLSPSNQLDASAYLQSKADTTPGWETQGIRQAFIDHNLSCIDHYYLYGRSEGVSISDVPLTGVVDYSVAAELAVS